MANKPPFAQGSKARFRISLLLLGALLLAKLVWPTGRSASNADQTVAQSGEATDRFKPVGEENAQVWGLAGSLLNLFSGGPRTPSQRQTDWEQEEADRKLREQSDNKRHWEEYDQRRKEERDEREQEMYDRQQQQRAEEQQRYDRQQEEYYQKRQEEQGY